MQNIWIKYKMILKKQVLGYLRIKSNFLAPKKIWLLSQQLLELEKKNFQYGFEPINIWWIRYGS